MVRCTQKVDSHGLTADALTGIAVHNAWLSRLGRQWSTTGLINGTPVRYYWWIAGRYIQFWTGQCWLFIPLFTRLTTQWFQSFTQPISTLTYSITAPSLSTALVAFGVALTALFVCRPGASIEAIDIAAVTVAADNDRLMASSAMIAPCSAQIVHRQSLPGSAGLTPDEVRYFTRLCENTVGDAASERTVKSGLASRLSTRPFLPNSCLRLSHANQGNQLQNNPVPSTQMIAFAGFIVHHLSGNYARVLNIAYKKLASCKKS
jgi:hypothetical protein